MVPMNHVRLTFSALSPKRGRAGGSLGRGRVRGRSHRARLPGMVSSTRQPNESHAGMPAPVVAPTELAAGRRTAAQVAIASAERRERLLAASAAASRLLLQAPDVMAVVPKVLQLVGEAAGADRVSLMLTQPGDRDQLALAAEWRARSPSPEMSPARQPECVSLERWSNQHPGLSADLCCGRSVLCYEGAVDCAEQAAAEQCAADNTKALVPIFVGTDFVGVVGFVSHGERREIGSAELSALETAAGVIGAALHRERLVDAVRRERERALVNDKAAVLRKLEQLAGETELGAFLGGHVLMEGAERLEAAGGAVVVRDASHDEWRLLAYMRALPCDSAAHRRKSVWPRCRRPHAAQMGADLLRPRPLGRNRMAGDDRASPPARGHRSAGVSAGVRGEPRRLHAAELQAPDRRAAPRK